MVFVLKQDIIKYFTKTCLLVLNDKTEKNLFGVEEMEKLLGGDVGESIWLLNNPKGGDIKLLRALMLFRAAKLPWIAYGVEFI